MTAIETSSVVFKDTVVANETARLVDERGHPAIMAKNAEGDLID